MTTPNSLPKAQLRAFSLVEVLAAVAIIGVVIFLAIPNIVKVREDAEESLAKSRADALNVAAAAYFQAVGTQTAAGQWATDNNARYSLIKPYLAFAPASLSDYMPKNYFVNFHTNSPHRIKAILDYSNAVSATVRTNISY